MGQPTDDLFVALADRHRRRVMIGLLEGGPQTELVVPDDVHLGETDRDALHVQMIHTHLPKLEEIGLVEWDRDTHTVTHGPLFDEVRPHLRVLRDDRDTRPADLR